MSPPPCTTFFADGGLSQNLTYIGINVQAVLYGVELALYFKTMYTLLSRSRERKPFDRFYMIYSTVMILLVSVWVITETQYAKELWLLSKLYPSSATATTRAWLLGSGTVSIIALQLMTDAMMIYRCWMLWDCSVIATVPLILWVATLILGILMGWFSSTQGEEFLFGFASKLGLAYYSVTVFLNVITTGAICSRMIRLGKIANRLGHQYAAVYFSVATLIIESMLPYTLAGVAFLISLGVTSPTLVPFMSLYMMLMCLSSQLLIFRVSTKRTWEKGTGKPSYHSAIKFSPMIHSQSPDMKEVCVDEGTVHALSLPTRVVNA